MAVTEQDIEAYLSAYRQGKPSADTKRLTTLRNRLQEGTEYFDGLGISSPTGADFAGWRDVLKATKPGQKKDTHMSDKTAGDWVNDVKGFYDWKGDMQMQIVDIDEQPVIDTDGAAKSRRGRKAKPDGERRDVKISIYLTREVYDGIRDIAALSRQDVSNVIFGTLAELVMRNADKLNAYQDFLARVGTIK